MRVLIDLQGCQSDGSRVRGIGRYSLALIKAMLDVGRQHEFILLANANLFDLQAEFEIYSADETRQVRYCQWLAPGPLAARWPANQSRRIIARDLREFSIRRLQPDVVFIPSLFEGYGDNSVLSVDVAPEAAPTAVIHYDLIPLIQAETYLLPQPGYEVFYRARLAELCQAAQLLSISAYAAQEALEWLDLPAERITTISSACDTELFCSPATEQSAGELLPGALAEGFILYSGAGDPRKNLKRLVEAYAALPAEIQRGHQLALVGKLCEAEVTELKRWILALGLEPGRVVLVGYVDDPTLARLYRRCALFVLPSLHEGFGLPVLEAMSCGAAVIGSNRTSIPEVIGDPEALFDPTDVAAISSVLQRSLRDSAFRQRLLVNAQQRSKLFSWSATAAKALAAMERLVSGPEAPVDQRAWEWRQIVAQREQLYATLLEQVGTALAVASPGAFTRQQRRDLAAAIAFCERETDTIARCSIDLGAPLRWRLEGPYDSSYSLAILNRHLALALAGRGHRVALFATEGPGDYEPDPAFLACQPAVALLAAQAEGQPQDAVEVTSRNLYPPRVDDLHSRLNLLHAYGWEETGFPRAWVEQFNSHLQGITVMSEHVRKLLIDNGVSLPIEVCGLGTEHLLAPQAESIALPPLKGYRFLHVSSCFPRKGVEELLEAYGRAFTSGDPVSLIIKTFPNPHNAVEGLLVSHRQRCADYPHVVLLQDDLSEGQLRWLYGQAQVLVAPSKAEGFGLPLAEAMQLGIPVITTAWGGQLDFCSDTTAWLIDFQFEWAQSHFGQWSSVWAKPDVEHLAHLLRLVWQAEPGELQAKTLAAQALLQRDYQWSQVAERLERSVARIAASPSRLQPRFGWVSSWNVRCGIASYARQLIEAIDPQAPIFADHVAQPLTSDGPSVRRCWHANNDSLELLEQAVVDAKLNGLVVQFNYGFFDFPSLRRMLLRLHQRQIKLIVMMHCTIDPTDQPGKRLELLVDALACCDRVLVHSPADLNRLKDLGLERNVALFPHGLLATPPLRHRGPRAAAGGLLRQVKRRHRIASYGFCLPHKGLLELIAAVNQLRDLGWSIRLDMYNAEYPSPLSTGMITQVRQLIASLGLRRQIRLHTAYQSDAQSLRQLARADLIVYPYQQTQESSSAAVRHGLAAGPPVCVTPLPIFEDVRRVTHQLPGTSVQALADGLAMLLRQGRSRESSFEQVQQQLCSWRAQHQFTDLGQRLHAIMTSVLNS
jgi:glycosyltransferase involved in cell wall biosynthesis